MEADERLEKARASIVAYHTRTKHHFDRYARGPGRMDWATQPHPFRRFSGAPEVPLPLAADRRTVLFADLFQSNAVPPEPLSVEAVAVLLELSFGLSAWKSLGGDSWALRCNPSSGNLHPTECYVAVSAIEGLDDGLYHYASRDHVLEQRCAAHPPLAGLVVGLSSIHWREAWKYGERAYRYCQHDLGHALAGLRYAAGVLGWRVLLLEQWSDREVAAFLGLDRGEDFGTAERETPDLLCTVGPEPSAAIAPEPLLAAMAAGHWQGRATVLSPRHRHQWPVIDEVEKAARKPRTALVPAWQAHLPAVVPVSSSATAAGIIRQRRSAQDFDGVTVAPAATLWRLLDATLPRTGLPPFDLWPFPPRVHLLLFIHRVAGLSPGVYFFPRREGADAAIRPLLREECQWTAEASCPLQPKLLRLFAGDCQRLATALSCHQEIAGDSVLSLGMLAEYDTAIAEGGWCYRRLFWESGMIGQALYLEAEAAGLRGTGIGCYFDDGVHEYCGLTGTVLQDLYHFTLGGSLTDSRIQTLPAYGHLQRDR